MEQYEGGAFQMRKTVVRIAVVALALVIIAGYSMPDASYAEDMSNPTATNVKYVKDKDGKNTGIKSFTIEPYTYLNIEPGETVRLDDGKLNEIAAKEIFPKWSIIANEVLRDQADQLVTIEGSDMMTKDKSSSNSFDRHFNTNNSSVSKPYSSQDWSVDNLAEKFALTKSQHKGKTEEDEMRATGITAIASLNDARTLMGQELRNCSNDNDVSVDDFLGNDKKSTKKSEYRLPKLEEVKEGSGFASIVTCVNQVGKSADYDYVTMGLAVYDFDLSPIAANNLKYVEDADKVEKGADILMGKMGKSVEVDGIKFSDTDRDATHTYLKNTTPNKSTHTSALKNTKTEKHTITTQDTFQWSQTQSVGMTINGPTITSEHGGLLPRVSFNLNFSWSELWASMKGEAKEKSDGEDKTVSSQLDLPPYTVAKITQNVNDKVTQEDYHQPVVLSYKVAIFAMSGDYFNGSGSGGINSSFYDKQWMSVIFDGSDEVEVTGNRALGSLYNRAIINKDTPGYDGTKGLNSWCDKSAWKPSNKIDWNNIAKEIADESRSNYDIESSKTGKKSTLENLATELPLLERASNLKSSQVNMSASLDQIVAYYPLKSVELKKDGKTLNTKANDTVHLDGLELQGLNEKNADFYGFSNKWGEWKLYDSETDKVIEDNVEGDEDNREGHIRKGNFILCNDEILNSQYVKVANAAGDGETAYLKWVIDPSDNTKITDNKTLTTAGRDKPYMTAEEKAKVSTPVIQLKIDDQASDAASVEVSGSYSGDYSETINLGEKLTARVYDTTGKVRGFPVYWEDNGNGGITVSENGNTEFTKDGTFKVRAYTFNRNSEKIFSDWIEIVAKKPAALTEIKMIKPEFEDEDLVITKKHPSREFDLTEYLDYYDQYGEPYRPYYDPEKEEGERWVSRDIPEIEFSVDDEEGAYVDESGLLTVYKPGTYTISARAYEEDGDGTKEYLGYKINEIKIKLTREDWLESIGLEYPSMKPSDMMLQGDNDAVVIKDLASQLRFYDQDGNPWDGKEPTVLFDVNAERNQAQIRNGDLYIYEPGNYTLYAMADGFDINTVDIQVTGKEGLVIGTVDPSVLKITDQNPEPSVNLERFVEYLTPHGAKWKGTRPALEFSLDSGVKGARIETRSHDTEATGTNSGTYPALIITQPGEYRVHVKAKNADEYSDSIDDIVVRADNFKTVASVILDGDNGHYEEVIDSYSDDPSVDFSIKKHLAYLDQDGNKLDPQNDNIRYPEVRYSFSGDAPSKDEAVISDGVLTAYKPGTYVVSVNPEKESVKGTQAVIVVRDITSVHNFGEWELVAPLCRDEVTRAKVCGGHDTDGDGKTDEDCDVTIDQTVKGAGEHIWSNKYVEEEGTLYKKTDGAEDEYTLVSSEDVGEGIQYYKRADIICTACNRELREGKTIYYPEDQTLRNTEPATCTDDGKYDILDENEQVVRNGQIPAAGHDYKYTVTKEPTCTEEGTEALACTREGCDAVLEGSEVSVPRLNHYSEGERTEEPATCTEQGKVYYTCDSCKKQILEEVLPALGHKWKAPTYKWEGNTSVTATRVCANDSTQSHSETETVRTTATVTKKPTTSAKGQTTYTAKFTNTAFKTQKKTVTNIPKLHSSKVTAPTGKPTILNTIANSAKKTNDVIWDKSKVKGANKYEINWKARTSKKWASATVGNVTRGKTTGLSIGGLYDIRVRPVAVSAIGKKASGAWSNTVYRYFHTTGGISLSSTAKGSFTMKWRKNSAATGYQIMFTTNSNGSGAAKNINTVGASATSFTKKGLKSGTTYYVQIREIKKVGSTTYIGNISNPVKVKVK